MKKSVIGKKFSKKGTIVIIVVLVVIAIGLGIGSKIYLNSKTVKLGFEDIGELATQSAYCTQVDTIKDKRDLWGIDVPFTQSQYVYSYEIVIKAGYDFKDIKPNINKKTKVINIVMPKAKILSSEIKEDTLKIYVENKNCFTPLTLDKASKARVEMKKKAEKTAIDNGLYTNAFDNAKVLLKTFIGKFYNLKEYKINFKETK